MKKFTVLLVGCCLLLLFGVQLAHGQSQYGTDNSSNLPVIDITTGQYIVPSCSEMNDQANTGTSYYYVSLSGSQAVAQSFTADKKGRLMKVQIDFQAPACPYSNNFMFTAELLDGNGWNCSVLASELITVPLPYNRAMLPIEFSNPATVYIGQPYTLKLTPLTGQLCDSVMGGPMYIYGMWYISGTDNYSGGMPYVNGNPESYYDTYFITTVNPNSIAEFVQTACFKYTWHANGLTYYNGGIYQTIINNSLGCDSLLVLNLTINTVDATITKPDPFTLQAQASGASYQWLDCSNDLAPIGGAYAQTFIPGLNGVYAVEVSMWGCVDTSDCITISAYGLAENDFGDALKVYPNPTDGFVTVELGEAVEQLNVKVCNALGQIISDQIISTPGTLTVETGLSPGFYFISIYSREGKMARIKVLKE